MPEDSQPNERIDKRGSIPSLAMKRGGARGGRGRGRGNPIFAPTRYIRPNPGPPSKDASNRVVNIRPNPGPSSNPFRLHPNGGMRFYPPLGPPAEPYHSPTPAAHYAPIVIKSEDPPSPILSPTTLINVKRELPTPSPPPSDPPRRSVTSGSKRCFPVPLDCTRAHPQYSLNRQKWARHEARILRDLGLRVVKSFFRDDGMVLEWTSDEPVWFDTLRPVHTPPPEIIDVDPEPLAVSSHQIINVDSVPSPAVDMASLPSSPTLSVQDISPEEEQERLQDLGLDFLLKYISIFDDDRPSLDSAYSENAVFSFRDNRFEKPEWGTFQRPRPQSKMPQPPALRNYRFAPRGEIILDYDTVVQEPMIDTPARVILSVYGQLVGPDHRTLAIDQCFLLQKVDRVAAATDDAWPLVAISHHMVVRDKPWIPWKGNLDEL